MDEIVRIFRFFGFWNGQKVRPYSKQVKIFQFAFFASFPILLVLGAIECCETKETIFLSAASIAVSVQVVRLFCIVFKQNQIVRLIEQIECSTSKNSDQSINDTVKRFMKFTLSIVLVITVTMVMAIGFFAVSTDRSLPANFAFPLDYRNSELGYWIALTYTIAVCIYSMAIFLLNIVIWYLMLQVSINYHLLGNRLRRIGDEGETVAVKRDPFLYNLIQAVEDTEKIRGQIVQFKSCFSALILIQITTSGMGIGGSVYTLAFSYHQSLRQTLIYFALLLYNFFDIFTLMLFGNKIKVSGDRLSYCLFECSWLKQTNSCKKCLIIVFEVLKRDHQLIIGKLYRLRLETFSSILNLAYSMFNILQSLK